MVVVYGYGYNPIITVNVMINVYPRYILTIIFKSMELFLMVVVYGCFLMVMPDMYSVIPT